MRSIAGPDGFALDVNGGDVAGPVQGQLDGQDAGATANIQAAFTLARP